MRTKRLLLAASALSTLTFGCSKDTPKQEPESRPLPGNPKGTFYDAAVAPPPEPDAAPRVIPPPGNPKGTLYDAGAAPSALDAGVPDAAPSDARVRRPDKAPLNSNPKGSFYDKGLDKDGT